MRLEVMTIEGHRLGEVSLRFEEHRAAEIILARRLSLSNSDEECGMAGRGPGRLDSRKGDPALSRVAVVHLHESALRVDAGENDVVKEIVLVTRSVHDPQHQNQGVLLLELTLNEGGLSPQQSR